MKSFKCPYCKKHQNAIGFVFDWTKDGISQFRKHVKVYHPRKSIKKALLYCKQKGTQT